MPTKKDTKRTLQMFAEFAIKGVLGKVPRPLRRSAGRAYVTEAYRVLTNQLRFNPKLNSEVITWIVKEYTSYVSGVAREASSGSDVGSAASGPDSGDSAVDLCAPVESES